MRILFDTNVIIASFISHGSCHELFNYCITSNHKIFLSEWIIEEVRKKLVDKFEYSNDRVREVITLLKQRCNIIENYKLKERICRDKDNDNILSAGDYSKVDCIITGDDDLLDIKKFKKIKIIKPKDFWSFEKKNK